jgi:bifunctional non-homologous end joining protein LigD
MKSLLTNLDKLYWPQDKITKGDLLRYYEKIAPTILPYLKNRPLVLHRFPDGYKGEHFYQKEAGSHLPSFVKTTTLQHEERKISYIVVQNVPTLLYTVNLGSIELHPFNAILSHLAKPDYMVFDLDPEGISFDAVVDTAQAIHEILEEIGIASFCKTTGATGLHIYVPLHGKYTYDQVLLFANMVATLTQRKLPRIATLERSPAKRQKKVYIDIFQNHRTKTLVSAYSVRGMPHATVSTPLQWKEVKHCLDPTDFTIKTVPGRLSKKGDLFKGILGKGINLRSSLKQLEKLI